jgi:kynurenine formamidase
MKFIDLSAPIEPSAPAVPAPFRTDVEYVDHAQGAAQIEQMFGVGPELLRDGEGWAVDTLHLGTHNSTHVDAPWHYNSRIAGERAQSIDELPLEWFHAPGVVLDFRHKADGDVVTPHELEAALAAADHELSPLDIVLIRTGRDALYGTPEYLIAGPGVSQAATLWLHERGVRVMGIDAWGWDAPLPMQAEEAKRRGAPGVFWAAHQAGIAYSQIERLVGLDALPPTGFTVSCFPLRVVRGSAGPARVVAMLEEDQ